MDKATEFNGSDGRDRGCGGKESPPFFAGKHRTHQGQVRRATGKNIGAWWAYVNDLILHGHGPLGNVLDNYTLTHLNKFLQEIDNRARRERIGEIYNLRIAQLESKHFREQLRKLQQQDRQIRAAQARAEGRRLDLEPSEQEAQVLDNQRHIYFSDLPVQEQEKFKREQEQMWSLIPEQFRAKAERLARGEYS